MKTFEDIVTLRTVREYSDRPIQSETLETILQAGRVSGSSRNTQPWRFFVVRTADVRARLAECVFAPDNLTNCQAVVIITASKSGFDIGRCAQNMMIAAWSEGVGSAPNGIKDPDSMAQIIGLEGGEVPTMALSLGYPRRLKRDKVDIDGVLRRIDRKSLDEIVVWADKTA
jgi:nitroreductase